MTRTIRLDIPQSNKEPDASEPAARFPKEDM